MKTLSRPEAFIVDDTVLPKEHQGHIEYTEVCKETPFPTVSAEVHPLATVAGSLKDDPFWDSMMAAIQSRRREINAEYEAAE